MKYSYVAIEREYGSGGTEIAKKLAAACGIPCYGREIPEMLSKEYGIPMEQIDRYEETVTNSFLYSLVMMGKATSGSTDMLTHSGQLFVAEQAVIAHLAAQGAAVFLGHCAGEALRENTRVLRVFIRADKPFRLHRAVTEYGIAENAAEAAIRRYDKKRSNYFHANTLKRWSDAENHDLVLNSGTLGIDGCVSALMGLVKRAGER